MKAKPILSTPVMNLDARSRDYMKGDALALCVPTAASLFGLFKPTAPPPRVRLHFYGEDAPGRVCAGFRYRQDAAWPEMRYHLSPYDYGYVYEWLADQLLAPSALGPRLRAGKTITLYVALEVVEAAK